MSAKLCYFMAEACAKGHVVGCPARDGDPWAEETKPRATPMPPAESPRHDWMGNRSVTGKRVEGGGLRCEKCELWIPNTEDARWYSDCVGAGVSTTTAAAPQTFQRVVLSAAGDDSGWRQLGNGTWVLDA